MEEGGSVEGEEERGEEGLLEEQGGRGRRWAKGREEGGWLWTTSPP